MKLYRVVPNIFSTGKRLESTDIVSVEALYYQIGYASFSGEFGMHKYNNVFEKGEEIKEGKYFFPFLEDAIKQGYYLLTKSQKLLDVGTFYIVEYDFPADIVLKHFGFGDYRDDFGLPNYLMEVYIEKDDFITTNSSVLTPNQISYEKKIETLTSMLKDTLDDAKTKSEVDREWYTFYCWHNYIHFDEFKNNPEQILRTVKRLETYMPYSGQLIQTDYLTGKIIKINIRDTMSKYGDWEAAGEYFSTLGRCDFSQNQQDFKYDLIGLSGFDGKDKKDSEKVLSLLQSRQYIQ